MMKQCWPAPERNKGPILSVLTHHLPEVASILEIAGGSGQHAAHFARARPSWTWHATDVAAEHVASMGAWARELALPNLPEPFALDVCERPWTATAVDAVFCANMIHIAPWTAAQALVAGAGELLRPGGLLLLYGPFRVGGEHTAPSNASFDESLKGRDPEWGVRDLQDVDALAAGAGLERVERVPMPANNQTVIWRRVAADGRDPNPGS
jgi:SAM-dependent methyltransferase